MAKSTNKTFTKEEMIQAWTESPFSAEIRKAANDVLAQFKKGESSSEVEAFTIPLEFGTGGIRGVIGSGIGRMNEYTVGRAALGFCRFLKAKYKNKKTTLVIAYDSRRRSREFAEVTAGVAAKHKIKVQLFPVVTPTPMLSYAVRHLKAQAGVVVTASHNPPEYNGFKAYLADGGQLVAPDDAKIIASIDNVSDWNEIPIMKKTDADYKKYVKNVDKKVFASYIKQVLATPIYNTKLKAKDRNYSIVYSPLHGTGGEYMKTLLNKAGYKRVSLVPEQEKPNGEFPTVKFPNPEEREALALSETHARRMDAQIFVATDPDADRMGVGIRRKDGSYELLNGNQIGSIMCAYLCEKVAGQKKFDYHVFKTIVTTELQEKIASKNKIKLKNVLTGFKFIGSEMTKIEKDKKKKFLFGGEESYGYLPVDLLRDKDSLSSTLLLLEILSEKKDVLAYLNEIYMKYGLYMESLKSITLKGEAGKQKIKESLERLRNTNTQLVGSTIGKRKILGFIDYKNKKMNGEVPKNIFAGLPSSDVIQLVLSGSGKLTIRPSGTEPKIKLYSSFLSIAQPHSVDEIERMKKELVDEIKESEILFVKLAGLNE